MQLIKLDAIDSTNQYLGDLVKEVPLEDYAAVMANYQTHGRGQRGASWQSDYGKNLIISVLKQNINTKIQRQFYLNMRVSLAVFRTLKGFKLPELAVKWPNDILSGQKKISGILIELITQGHQIKQLIIGVGININQTHFENLPNASSIKTILGTSLNVQDIGQQMINAIKFYFEHFSDEEIKAAYEKVLFKKDKTSKFLTSDHTPFSGVIKGVSNEGRLKVIVDNKLKLYDLKTISMLY